MNSSFKHLYKSNSVIKSQQERREELLLSLKQKRAQALDEKRNITDLFDDDSCNDEQNDQMEFENVPVANNTTFYNRLMLSEWLSGIPEDIEQNWYVKLCPVGTRSLVVATQNITVAYNRVGKKKSTFRSFLPGGGSLSCFNENFTVLDCIFNPKRRCYFVLDVLAWNSLSVKKCDTEFRFFWLKSKFDENPELQNTSNRNKYPFYLIDFFPAELSLIEDRFSRPYCKEKDDSSELDGILFYHRFTHYIRGYTPLVGWLKSYMLPEMFNIPIHESYLTTKPDNYISLVHYLERKKKLKNSKIEMDTNS